MKKDSLLNSFGIIFAYLSLEIVLDVIYSIIKNFTTLMQNHIINNFSLIMISTIILMFIIHLLKSKLSNQWKNFKKNSSSIIKKSLKYWFIGFLLMIASNLIINLIIPNGLAPNEELNRLALKKYPVYSCISICILGPITEELLFRLNFKSTVKGRTPFILLTGLVFSLMHILFSTSNLIEIIYIIPYSMLGFAFGALYYDTDNIYSSIFAHILHNTLATTIILLGI